MDNEARIDARIESAARHARESARHLFVAGYQAAKVYGLFQEAATAEIARLAGVTDEAVRHWVYGYRCFAAMSQLNLEFAKLYRREFKLTHFQTMQEYAEQYGLSVSEQMIIFYELWGHKQNGDTWSVIELKTLIGKHLQERGIKSMTPVHWEYHFQRLLKPLSLLKTFDGELPPPVRAWVVAGLRLFE